MLKKGDALEIIGFGKSLKTTVNTMEMFHKTLDRVEAGDQAGVLIKNVKRDEIKRGMVAVKAGSVQPTRGLQTTVSFVQVLFGVYHLSEFVTALPSISRDKRLKMQIYSELL